MRPAWQKVSKTLSTTNPIKKLSGVACAYKPSYMGSLSRRTAVQGWPWTKTREPISKITKAKRAGGIAQVIEFLPSKYTTLRSSPGIINKKAKT
jgi:hypothetical protein